MGVLMSEDVSEHDDLLRRAKSGDEHALAALFTTFRERLKRMVAGDWTADCPGVSMPPTWSRRPTWRFTNASPSGPATSNYRFFSRCAS